MGKILWLAVAFLLGTMRVAEGAAAEATLVFASGQAKEVVVVEFPLLSFCFGTLAIPLDQVAACAVSSKLHVVTTEGFVFTTGSSEGRVAYIPRDSSDGAAAVETAFLSEISLILFKDRGQPIPPTGHPLYYIVCRNQECLPVSLPAASISVTNGWNTFDLPLEGVTRLNNKGGITGQAKNAAGDRVALDLLFAQEEKLSVYPLGIEAAVEIAWEHIQQVDLIDNTLNRILATSVREELEGRRAENQQLLDQNQALAEELELQMTKTRALQKVFQENRELQALHESLLDKIIQVEEEKAHVVQAAAAKEEGWQRTSSSYGEMLEELMQQEKKHQEQLTLAVEKARALDQLQRENALLSERLKKAEETHHRLQESVEAFSQWREGKDQEIVQLQAVIQQKERFCEAVAEQMMESLKHVEGIQEENTQLKAALAQKQYAMEALAISANCREEDYGQKERAFLLQMEKLQENFVALLPDFEEEKHKNQRLQEEMAALQRENQDWQSQLQESFLRSGQEREQTSRLQQENESLKQAIEQLQCLAQAASKKIEEKTEVSSSNGQKVHVIAEGENLNNISMKYYGTPYRWSDIYEANVDIIENVNKINVGTRIIIPR